MNYFPRKIYAIQHNKTKRMYIGSSKDVQSRYKAHIYKLKAGKHPVEDMQSDYDEYGENYSVFILEEITERSERYKEYEWMLKYNTLERGNGYNYKDHFTKRFYLKDAEVFPFKEGFPT